MNAIEKIRAEIEQRRKAQLDKNGNAKDLFCAVRLWAYADLLGIIDTITEPPVPAEESVDRWVVTNAFLKCDRAGKIVSEMYGDKLNNPRNRDKYLAFLQQVNLDDRFGELADLLRKHGAMPALKEQPVSDLEAEIDREVQKLHTAPCYDELRNFACHISEWRGKRVAAYIRECLEPVQQCVDKWDASGAPYTSSYYYDRGKVQGYKDILRDLESGSLDKYISEKEKEE